MVSFSSDKRKLKFISEWEREGYFLSPSHPSWWEAPLAKCDAAKLLIWEPRFRWITFQLDEPGIFSVADDGQKTCLLLYLKKKKGQKHLPAYLKEYRELGYK